MSATMKAVVWTAYGSPDGLELQTVEKPVPQDDEILVKVRATTVTAGDCEMRRLQLPLMLSWPMRIYAGIRKPTRIKILGQELAGEVVEVGRDVQGYEIGEEVFGTTGFRFGAYAEYICLPGTPDDAQGALAPKPENLSFEAAAAVPTAGFEALHFVREADLQPGQKMLVFGAGGSIGTLAVQLAAGRGAEVTAVDSAEKLEMLQALGAHQVIDYAREDFTRNGQQYDAIIDVVGRQGFARRLQSLAPNGRYFLAYAGFSHVVRSAWSSMTGDRKVIIGSASQTKDDLLRLKGLIEAGQLKPVIDRSYPLGEMAAAHRYAESGQKMGNIAITVAS
jgi:2-desacetyl-2-hydroxyethyl bacteriochlorophyllide A dehydrogenase